jgi:hypothetical protein
MMTRRISPGIYEVAIGWRTYEIERYPDGAWLMFEMIQGHRDYIGQFPTLTAAKRWCLA